MATPLKFLVLAGVLAGVAACAPNESGRAPWTQEAGATLDNGSFGYATLHNMLAQSCKSAGYSSLKGGAVKDPLVVLDPTSTANRPVYRVHCDGELNGKYARVIFGQYIASAAPTPETGIALDGGQ